MTQQPSSGSRGVSTTARCFAALAFVGLAAGVWNWLEHFSICYTVSAHSETASVPSDGDAADDICLWVAPGDGATSFVLATDKKAGIGIFGLDGRLVDFFAVGRINNIDLREDFPFESGTAPIVAASNKTTDMIDVFRFDTELPALVLEYSIASPPGFEPDGFCLYHSARDGAFHAISTAKNGRLVQFRLEQHSAILVRDLALGSESEGCVADDELGKLYVSEENVAIWRLPAEPADGDRREAVETVSRFGRLAHDVEGLAILRRANGEGYLVASSQGRNEFVVFERGGHNEFVGRFRIGEGNGVDSVSHTDGIEIASAAIGPNFPVGLMIVQDDDDGSKRQNFKLVSWRDIEVALARPF
jgi:3-phytase